MAFHDHFPLRTVTQLTGLSADVIRAWEKRYGVVTPPRGPRGARLYSREDIVRLRLLGAVVRNGRAIGDVANLDTPTLEAMAAGRSGQDDRPPEAYRSSAEFLADQVLDAVERYDSVAMCDRLADALTALGADRFLTEVCAPLLRSVGERWHAGEFSIAQEHMATNAIRNLLHAAIQARAPRTAAQVLLATPAGEHHEGGLLMVALALADAGVGIRYLGADLPSSDIVDAAIRLNVAVVGLSVSAGNEGDRTAEEVRAIANGLPAATRRWLGGSGVSAIAGNVDSRDWEIFASIAPAVEKALAFREIR